MNIALFSGQGSQYAGMTKDLYESQESLSVIYDTASEILNKDIKGLCFNTDDTVLGETINSQPAIMTASLVCLQSALNRGFVFSGVAGHSLGEYAAMVASEMISMEDGFRLIKARSEAMDKAAKTNKGAMSAVLKLTPEQIEEVCKSIDGYVVPVNYNSPQQTVIAGTTEAVQEATEKLTALKARIVPLKVASAFHSELMKTASEEFYETAKTITFKSPKVKYYSNVTGKELTDFSNMPEILANHIVSPVLFTSELNEMEKDGFTEFYEFGPNKVLTGLVKKTLKNVKAVNIENLKTLDDNFSL
ncbi:MAG: ACP S-malonyltransferase [Oscillospiraceae bacterium]|nr:ACP S-malonyltransferase [Oscillospiraceae bacterium]